MPGTPAPPTASSSRGADNPRILSSTPLGRADPIAEHSTRTARQAAHRHDQRSRRYARAVQPSPARARPHDATTWLPLPDVDDLPTIEELIGAPVAATNRPTTPVGRGADVRPLPARPAPPVVRPSPARAEPHDPDSWFPLLALEDLLPADQLVDSGQTRAVTATEAAPVVEPEAPEALRTPLPTKEWEPRPLPTRERSPDRKPEARPARQPRGAAARRTSRTVKRRRAMVLALAAATVAAGAVVVPNLVTNQGPKVTLRVDGKKLVVHTDADTVREVLREEEIRIGRDDRIEPAPTAKVSDGLAVAVFRAFDLPVDVDGTVSSVRTTRVTANGLRRELGLDPDKVAVKSAPQRLGEGASVVFRTRHDITMSVDGTTQDENSIALNVGELLGENSVVLGPMDQVNPPVETPLTDGMVVSVVRVTNDKTETLDEPVAFGVERRDDPSLAKGEERVSQEGVPGMQRVTYQITEGDGVEMSRSPISKVLVTPPVPKVIQVGTALPNSRTGTASWYASPFGSDSCATKEYVPKGTIVRVTNLDTGASTTCRVADRVVAMRVVDLDDDVFRQLAPLGQGVFNARIDW